MAVGSPPGPKEPDSANSNAASDDPSHYTLHALPMSVIGPAPTGALETIEPQAALEERTLVAVETGVWTGSSSSTGDSTGKQPLCVCVCVCVCRHF